MFGVVFRFPSVKCQACLGKEKRNQLRTGRKEGKAAGGREQVRKADSDSASTPVPVVSSPIMDMELPEELSCVPCALVAVQGLKAGQTDNPLHHEIWRRFHSGAGGANAPSATAASPGGPDLRRAPLRFVAAEDMEWPQMKPKRNSYEWFIPKGILKKNW